MGLTMPIAILIILNGFYILTANNKRVDRWWSFVILQEFIYAPIGTFYALYFYHRKHEDHERWDWYYFQATLFSM